jgi:hypothetical protein
MRAERTTAAGPAGIPAPSVGQFGPDWVKSGGSGQKIRAEFSDRPEFSKWSHLRPS